MSPRNGSSRRLGGSRRAVARAAAAAAALLVAAAVVAVAPAAAQSHRFPDVAPDHYAFEAVEWAAQVAVTAGYVDGTFKPEQPLIKRHAVVFMERYYDEILQADESEDFTRGDMMVLLKAINDGTLRGTDTPGDPAPGTTGADQSHRFPDVAPDHYAFEAVEWAAQVAVTAGYVDGTFKPEQPLIKRHAVVFMERYYDEILQADESEDFTRGDMMVLLKAINDGTLRGTDTPGDPAGTEETAPVTGFTAVSAGNRHACGVRADNTVECWGDNLNGQSGVASSSATTGRACLVGQTGDRICQGNFHPPAGQFISVSAGSFHSCGVRTDNTVHCWGADDSGQSSAPSGQFISVSAGGGHSCGVRTDNTVHCWGADDSGQSSAPSGQFISVSTGINISCGVRADNTVHCWGAYLEGSTSAPSGQFISVSTAGYHSCGVRTDNTVHCWGDNFEGSTSAPSGQFISVSAGINNSCGVRADNTVQCWGHDHLGQSSAPSGAFISVSTGSSFACGVRLDNTIECWGSDRLGKATPPSA